MNFFLDVFGFLHEMWSADVWFPPCVEACAHLSPASPHSVAHPAQANEAITRQEGFQGSKNGSGFSNLFVAVFFSTWNHKICIMILSKVQNWYSSTFYSISIFFLPPPPGFILPGLALPLSEVGFFYKIPSTHRLQLKCCLRPVYHLYFCIPHGTPGSEAREFMSFPTLRVSFLKNIAPIHLLVCSVTRRS